MTLDDIRSLLMHNADYLDGCMRHIVCVNVRDVLLRNATADYCITDWVDGSAVETYRNGKLM